MPAAFYRDIWLGGAALLFCLLMANGAGAAETAADTVFGIRLGVALESQFEPCPQTAARPERLPERPCWAVDPIWSSERTVLLPKAMYRVGLITIKRIREANGVVVEVDSEFNPRDLRKVRSYLDRELGEPSENENTERASRVSGLSGSDDYTWRRPTTLIFLQEVSASDDSRLHGYLVSWVEAEQRRQAAGLQP